MDFAPRVALMPGPKSTYTRVRKTGTTSEQLYEWLHTHKFVAQSNAIVEFINNIRWGIYDYLQPEYQRSTVRHADGIGYQYTYPENINDELARANYWELMNKVRQPPYFQRFEVPEFWKNRVDEF